MKEIYAKLNFYLNEIFKYLEQKHPMLLNNIDELSALNDAFLKHIKQYNLEEEITTNHLSYEDVFLLAREIIEHIDKSYLKDFDNLIQSGELDFSFEDDYEDSECVSIYADNEELKQQLVNVNRQFNYSDVRVLIHEFFHYTNGKKYSINRKIFTEFLSIYFEMIAIDYLLQKGIPREELDVLFRMQSTKKHATIFYQYEIVLLAFEMFGNLDEHTVPLLQQFFLNIDQETFEKECSILYKNLCKTEEIYKYQIQQNPNILGCLISEEWIAHNYRYVFGTLLAIYAHKYVKLEDVVALNNRITENDNQSVFDICLSIGIDLTDPSFKKKLFDAIDEYLQKHIQDEPEPRKSI